MVSSGMVSSRKVSCIVFVMHLLLRVMCVLMHVHVLVGVNVSVIMCILVWIHVHVCVAPPIVVGAWPMAGTLWRLFESLYSLSKLQIFVLYNYRLRGELRSTCAAVHPHAFAKHNRIIDASVWQRKRMRVGYGKQLNNQCTFTTQSAIVLQLI